MSFITFLSTTLSTEEDQIKIVLSFFSMYPIALLNYKLKSPTQRLWLGLVTGLALQYFMFGYGGLITYLFLKFFGRKVSGFYLLAFTFLHLSYLHIKRMIEDYGGWQLDISVIYMMTIIKFSSLAFSYEDGAKNHSDLKCTYHKKKKVVELPTLLEVISYTVYFNTSMCGPAIEFADFISFIRLENEYKEIPKDLAKREGLEDLLICIGFMAAKVIFSPIFEINYLISDEFYYKSYLYKFGYVYCTMGLLRIKYYIGWKMSQSTITFSGLSYNPRTEVIKSGENEEKVLVHSFDKNENCTLKRIELELNPKIKMQYWNRSVHLWLKYNVFIRLINLDHPTFNGRDSIASLTTFIISAIWHGFYPMYYFFFLEAWLLEQSCTMLEKKLRFYEKIEKSNILIRLIVLTLTMNLMNVLGLQFGLLLSTKIYLFCRNLFFIPLIIIVGLYFYLAFIVKGNRKPKTNPSEITGTTEKKSD